MTEWIIERCMQTGAMVRILTDEEGTREIHYKPEADPCYCGWEGIDDIGCSCIHPDLRSEEE
jgi:hypothetical protein